MCQAQRACMMLWLKTFCNWGHPLTYDNLSKSLHTFPLGFYPSLFSFKTSGLFWPLRKSSVFFMLYPRCSDSNPSNTCYKCHMSRAGTLTPGLPSYEWWLAPEAYMDVKQILGLREMVSNSESKAKRHERNEDV